jgi:hypothetical protein
MPQHRTLWLDPTNKQHETCFYECIEVGQGTLALISTTPKRFMNKRIIDYISFNILNKKHKLS